ncbi:MAG: L-threonylcarbamoyladenylate synthase [Desulfurococcaceae archaeon]
MTLILKASPEKPDPAVLRKAAEVLRSGGLVAFPTETVYGLGGAVFLEDSIKKIFLAKQRPLDNPLIIHVCDESTLSRVAVNVPEKAYKLINVFWPGPLTLILPRHPNIPKVVTGGLNTVAVRMPAHPIALSLIKEADVPIAAPSANLAGRPSPTSADHVIRDLYGRIDIIIDGGETLYGIESTIVNILMEPPVLLRPGAYSVEDIERVLGEKISVPDFARGLKEFEIALAPGTRYKHYAPQTPIMLVEPLSGSIERLVSTIINYVLAYASNYRKVCVVSSRETIAAYFPLSEMGVIVLEIGSRKNLFEVARNMFKLLRALDDTGCSIAIIEGFEERGLGLAVMNRLRKASHTIIPA